MTPCIASCTMHAHTRTHMHMRMRMHTASCTAMWWCIASSITRRALRSKARLGITLVSITAEGFVPLSEERGALRRMFEAAAAPAQAPATVPAAAPAPAPAPTPAPASAPALAVPECLQAGEGALVGIEAHAAATAEEEAAAVAAAAAAAAAAESAERAEAASAEAVVASTEAAAAAAALQAEWTCGACTLLNEAGSTRCAVCDALRGSTLAGASRLAEQVPGRPPPPKRPRHARGGRGGTGSSNRGRGRGAGAAGGGQANLVGLWKGLPQ